MLVCEDCGRSFEDYHALRTHQGQLIGFIRHRWLAKEKLYKLYCQLGLPSRKIASILGCSPDQVKIALRAHGLRRTKSEAGLLSYEKERKKPWNGGKPPSWNGGIKHHRLGYRWVLAPTHHRADKDGYVLEHILIWEEVNKRQLPHGWVIHHRNSITSDNHPENLMAFSSNGVHMSFHAAKRQHALKFGQK